MKAHQIKKNNKNNRRDDNTKNSNKFSSLHITYLLCIPRCTLSIYNYHVERKSKEFYKSA